MARPPIQPTASSAPEAAATSTAAAPPVTDPNEGLPPPVILEDEDREGEANDANDADGADHDGDSEGEGPGQGEGASFEAASDSQAGEVAEPSVAPTVGDAAPAEVSAAPEPVSESGWLIERAGSPTHTPEYLSLKRGRQSWTDDHLEAVRFGRELDAKDFADIYLGELDRDRPRFAEHAWR